MDSKQPSSVYQKIARVMGDIGAIKPDKKHPNNYMYRSADHVYSVIQQSMIKHGLVILSEAPHADYMEDGRYLVSYRFTFIDPDTGDSHTCAWLGEAVHTFYKFGTDGKMTGRTINDRAINQSATNALKYFLLKTFLVSDQETDDPEPPIQRQPTTNGKSSSTGDVHGAPQAQQGWATIKTVDYLLDAARTTYPSLSQAQFIKAAGITSYTAYDEWNEKYTAGIEASAAIKHALEAEPVTPSSSPLPVNGEGPGVGSKKSAFSKPSFPEIRGATPRRAATIAINSVTYEPVNRAHRWGTGYTEDGYHVELFESDKAMFKQLGCDVEIWIERAGSTHKNAYTLDRPVTVITQQEHPHRIDEAATLALYLQSVSF